MFLRAANRDEFNVGDGQAIDLQQQVAQVFAATSAVDEQANIEHGPFLAIVPSPTASPGFLST